MIKVLEDAGADRDGDGDFMIFGADLVVGIGGDEVIVKEGTQYAVGGERRCLLSLLHLNAGGVSAVLF